MQWACPPPSSPDQLIEQAAYMEKIHNAYCNPESSNHPPTLLEKGDGKEMTDPTQFKCLLNPKTIPIRINQCQEMDHCNFLYNEELYLHFNCHAGWMQCTSM
jgi:hypothetical protein